MTRKRRKTSATNTKNRTRVALGLGANIGEARAALCAAARILGGVLQDARFASLYRSRPRSAIAQPDFFNTAVVGMNEEAFAQMRCPKQLHLLPGATHLFEEPGALEQVAALAADWFARHFGKAA